MTRKRAAVPLDDGAVRKVHTNQPLTASDLDELKSIFVAAGVGSFADLDSAAEKAGSFSQFVRSLTGVDRATAMEAFPQFLSGGIYPVGQIRFVNLMSIIW